MAYAKRQVYGNDRTPALAVRVDDWLLLWVAVCALLAVFLCAELFYRLKSHKQGKGHSTLSTVPGHGVDVSKIAPRIQAVRENPVSHLQASPQHAAAKANRLAASRTIIHRLRFFREAREDADHTSDLV